MTPSPVASGDHGALAAAHDCPHFKAGGPGARGEGVA